MVSSGSIDEAVSLVTSCILSAANNAISQPSSRLPRFPKRWNEECQMAKKKIKTRLGIDSLSALQSIVSLHSSSHPILVDITYALANHLKKKDIRFCWIPGHARITGNELADTAARSATGSSERFPILHSDLKACFRQKLQSVSQSNWDQQTENKLHSVMLVLASTVPSSSNRREQVIWTRLRLGHTRLTHRHLLFGEPPPYCEICNVSLSVKHILCDCPHSNHLRIGFLTLLILLYPVF
ncbi:uncharacterized protein TNCT_619721 [Trichonephila clavata]|uniref:RNase H type-1 domain-containing protein n=1 Tax=Trichonephila clavata TaxID=2740835 RepID=A0A8X6K5I6_TRICU|nr:uncharacterized protein TNCT_619721 [Trichonephila clavata]